MRTPIIFKKGQNVMISESGANASDFNRNETWDILGAYAIHDWENTTFQIEGTVKLITFTHDKEIYGAYLLSHKNVPVGYVYNDALQPI